MCLFEAYPDTLAPREWQGFVGYWIEYSALKTEFVDYNSVGFQKSRKAPRHFRIKQRGSMKNILAAPSVGQKHGYKCDVWGKKRF